MREADIEKGKAEPVDCHRRRTLRVFARFAPGPTYLSLSSYLPQRTHTYPSFDHARSCVPAVASSAEVSCCV